MSEQPLWTSTEAAAAVAGTPSGTMWEASGVSIDSRTVQPGDLFIALQGPNHDGHDHVAGALANGAACALVHRLPAGVPDDAPLLLVKDTTAALEDLAAAARARSTARIVAVTGSVGKTGTKEMLRLVLAEQGRTHASTGNLNNHLGAPLSLARMPRDARFGVFELGMNHAGELTPLSRLVRPHVATITTVEAVHMEFFGSTEAIADAKAEVFAGLEPGGIAVLPRDNRHFHRLAGAVKNSSIQSFGSHIEATARLMDAAVDPEATVVFALLGERALSYRIGIPGLHWAMNSLAVLLVAEALGADGDRAAKALAGMSAPKGRGERRRVAVPGGNAELIDESYNASPVSMRAAIATLASAKPAKGARRIAVMGDMLELGETGPALHASLAETIENWGIDTVFTAGPLMRHLRDALPDHRRGGHAESSDALAPLVRQAVRNGDVVMVKGSAGSKMGRVVQALAEER
ncbi:UDP-N-acetylmuramoylalanyl-D-glutamyl-2, 6-diaminopimelate--D-alanyl-D-alanine ligase [Paramagnetospirillum kuznetsovii]|uniref:UDP-N-acetylmuramoyl-tripeptide--D-alanyl-D-alanine ligase n=1 Tax=Paramagnetospirillum kuznetsovii TaxID=2053833 RepID=A0A364P0N1_9PROT|nr:UDP-N-acetylmuramoylalanyl-D-glutamyl-2,6-diaminopimelate--D-alanyl-D-alanine ligase [Paramagnetospirillum kuznetsovii]RAU22908.1 UDP-N-acetylmuramoylalanyl-D-glutamyl-2, 6-diaminopimelate--D-alanyl-D-alanine ligase [Paramagnetospirillum kuznetsovii]